LAGEAPGALGAGPTALSADEAELTAVAGAHVLGEREVLVGAELHEGQRERFQLSRSTRAGTLILNSVWELAKPTLS
jgi:hypothetical protein